MALGLVGAGTNSAVGGGTGNTASGQLAVIGGGIFNNATNSNSTVGGGGWNTAGGTSSTVAGGVNNQSSGSWSTIAGGQANTAAAPHSGVAGGNYNTINEGADFAHIGGGLSNTVGGATNYWSNGVTWTLPIPSQSAIVFGGQNNTAVGCISTVAGGANNTAGATYSFAAGRRGDVLIALHGHGSYRWQFVKEKRDECRAARDVARQHGMLFISPDYRAKTSWMGPAAEADLVQIIGDLKAKHAIGRRHRRSSSGVAGRKGVGKAAAVLVVRIGFAAEEVSKGAL
jgi:hypothetical protein